MTALEAVVTWRLRPPFFYGWLVLGVGALGARAFNMCGDIATPNLYAVSQQNGLQALGTRVTIMCRRSSSSSSNDDVERAAP